MRPRKPCALSAIVFAALCGGPPATAAGAETALEEVLVTAQRREQNQQEVPITVNTISGDRLRNIFAAGDDIRALAARLPGLYAESSNGRLAPRFYIRGLGNTDFDLAASQPVSVVIDEVVQENVVLKSFPLFDLERIEVLKGPQGSLFGRNTPGGIVKLETVRPSHAPSMYVSLSRDHLETTIAEAAIGGSIVPDRLAGRLSLLLQDRGDWIDNDFTDEKNVTGRFREFAGRAQLLWNIGENWRMLGNLHWRNYEGTSPPFRANIIGPGNDSLNANYDRDRIYHDEGDGSPQEYEGVGGSLRLEYDLGDDYSVVSISAFERTDGSSRGDVDGNGGMDVDGDGVVGPDEYVHPPVYIPSHSQDGIDDLTQITQELSVTYASDRLDWRAGLYLFDSDLEITTNPFFVAPTTVRHENRAWALFGQFSLDLNDAWQLTVGGRYTNDEKDMEALTANFPVSPVQVEGDDFSWDLALNYEVNESLHLYTRLARGFRAPTIQGRDIAFFGQPSKAGSETITSLEAGIKSEWFDRRLRLNLVAFYYEIENQQLSAIGGTGNMIRLINADKGVGRGFEADLEWLITPHLSLTAGYSLNDTELQDAGLRISPCRFVDPDGTVIHICTVQDPLDSDGFAFVDGNPFPHAPRDLFYLTLDFAQPVRAGIDAFLSADYYWQGKTEFFLYDSAEFQSKGNSELGARAGVRANSWEVSVFARNLTDEDNLKGGVDFSNITGYLNEPRSIGVNLIVRFGAP